MPSPEKAERNSRLAKCAGIIRALFDGKKVTHRGRMTVIGARLYSRPKARMPLYVAAVSKETAAEVATWADGLLTVGGKVETVLPVLRAFRENGGEGKPVHIQHALFWAPDRPTAMAAAMHQWRHGILVGEAMWDLRRPANFDSASDAASEAELADRIPISDNLGHHTADIAALAAVGATVQLHCIGRNQEAFMDAYSTSVLPRID